MSIKFFVKKLTSMSKIKDFSIEENIYNYKHLFSLIIKLKSFSISKERRNIEKMRVFWLQVYNQFIYLLILHFRIPKLNFILQIKSLNCAEMFTKTLAVPRYNITISLGFRQWIVRQYFML